MNVNRANEGSEVNDTDEAAASNVGDLEVLKAKEAELLAKQAEEKAVLEREKKGAEHNVEGGNRDARESLGNEAEGVDADLDASGEETPKPDESVADPEDPGFFDGIKNASAASMIASSEKGTNTAMSWAKALGAGVEYFFKNFVGAIQGWWKKGKENEENEEADDEEEEGEAKKTGKVVPLLEEEYVVKGSELKARTSEFEDKVLSKNPDWFGYAEIASARYEVPISGIMAVASFESHFTPNAVNPSDKSNATGLGQFLSSTWIEFIAANPDFAGKNRKDPEAMIMAIAWYAREGADYLGISPYDENAVSAMYLYHHNGPGGTKDFLNYVKDGTPFKVPSTYWGKTFYGIYVDGVDDYKDYAMAVSRFARTVQATADSFQVKMDELHLG